jgi:hypothetical protein
MSTDDLPKDHQSKVQQAGPGLFLTGRQILSEEPLTRRAQPACPVLLSLSWREFQKEKLQQLDQDFSEVDRNGALDRSIPVGLQNAGESGGQSSDWQVRFAKPYWTFHESFSLAVYRLPEKIHFITPDNYRRKKWYGGEQFEQRRQEFLTEWQHGTIKAFIRGKEVLPAAAVDPSSLINDPDLVFQSSTVIARWLAGIAVEDKKIKKKNKTAEKMDRKDEAVIKTLEGGVRPIGDYRNIPPNKTKEWIHRVQLNWVKLNFPDEQDNKVRLPDVNIKKAVWPNRTLRNDIGLDRKTVGRILERLAQENDHVKELLATPGILPDLGDHPYPYP